MRLRAVPVTALVLISLPEAKSLFNDSGGSILIDGTHTFVSIPASIPAYAERLDPHLAAFSIEPDQWPLWAGQGVGKVNQFTYNLLEALGNRTGKGVYIRVGGNTEDRTHVDLTVPVSTASIPPATDDIPYHEAESVTIGRDYYALSHNLPSNTQYTWCLNLRALDVNQTRQQAFLLADSFYNRTRYPNRTVPLTTLASIEIGNEVDGYVTSLDQTRNFTNWNTLNYTYSWLDQVNGIKDILKNPDAQSGSGSGSGSGKNPTYQVGSFMNGGNTGFWNPLNVLGTEVFDSNQEVKGLTTTWSDHTYTGVWSGSPIKTGSLMGKGTVRSVLNARMSDVRIAKGAGKEFIFGETNSYANHGAPGISNTAESAIWAVDYLLQAATMGVSRLHFHHGIGYRYNSFQPSSGLNDGLNITRPHILPLYHAYLIVNEAIGLETSWVAELGTLDGRLSAYGIWEKKEEITDGKLVRVVLINSAVYQNGTSTRGTLHVKVGGVKENATMSVKRLATPFTDSYTNITWAGQSFDTANGTASGAVMQEVITGGQVDVSASEVVLISLG